MTLCQSFRQTLLYCFFLSLVAGCNQKYQSAGSLIKEALNEQKGVKISKQRIQNLPYASIFTTINNKGKVFMVLAFSDQGSITQSPTLKWLSADQAMIATQNGRIIKTIGLNQGNLAGLTHELSDPPPPLKSPNWQATYDWNPDYRYNFNAEVTTRYLGKEVISTDLWTKETSHIEENVYFPELQTKFKNQFWLDSDNQVVKTIQYLGPKMDKVEILFIKPYFDPATH